MLGVYSVCEKHGSHRLAAGLARRAGGGIALTDHFASNAHAGQAREIAAETSRIFLGIQIQCANCHDHPSDHWKREQFQSSDKIYVIKI